MEQFIKFDFIAKADKSVLVLLLFIVLILLRLLAGRVLNKAKNMPVERKRSIFVNINLLFTLFFVLSNVVIWTDEIRSLALSLAAILVAIVIATKEFTLNLLGGFFQIAQNSFHIGDRIEVEGMRGDVVDRSLLSTTLIEVGPGYETHQLTGRAVVIPNSVYLSHRVVNESYLKNYVLHTFKVPLPINKDWKRAEEILLAKARLHCAEYFDKAKEYLYKLHSKSHLSVPVLEPRVHVNVIDHEQLALIVRITAPTSLRGRIEQDILKDFLAEFLQ